MLLQDGRVELSPDQLVDPLPRRQRPAPGTPPTPRALPPRRPGARAGRSADRGRGGRCRSPPGRLAGSRSRRSGPPGSAAAARAPPPRPRAESGCDLRRRRSRRASVVGRWRSAESAGGSLVEPSGSGRSSRRRASQALRNGVKTRKGRPARVRSSALSKRTRSLQSMTRTPIRCAASRTRASRSLA